MPRPSISCWASCPSGAIGALQRGGRKRAAGAVARILLHSGRNPDQLAFFPGKLAQVSSSTNTAEISPDLTRKFHPGTIIEIVGQFTTSLPASDHSVAWDENGSAVVESSRLLKSTACSPSSWRPGRAENPERPDSRISRTFPRPASSSGRSTNTPSGSGKPRTAASKPSDFPPNP